MMKIGIMKSKKNATHVEKRCVIIRIKERDLNYTKKVRDHSHFTRKIRGKAHSICNLHYKIPKEIPVKIHNGSKYDYHLIINELAEEFRDEDFECLGENAEKYISFKFQLKKNVIMIVMKQSHTK